MVSMNVLKVLIHSRIYYHSCLFLGLDILYPCCIFTLTEKTSVPESLKEPSKNAKIAHFIEEKGDFSIAVRQRYVIGEKMVSIALQTRWV